MYTSRFLQFVIGGIQKAGSVDQDEWQIGLKVPSVGVGDPNDGEMTAINADALTDAETWWAGIGQHVPSSTALTYVKVNVVGQDGRYVNQEKTFRKDRASALTGGATATMPAEVALVVTLNTAAARGLASKGRVYLPVNATNAISNGRVVAGARDLVGNATAALVKNLSNIPGLDATVSDNIGDVSVMSKVGLGATRTVTSVRVGDLFDTQRRRANNMREVYTTYQLP